jgi:ornithine cyclodeaminase/alanine dehydrogenase-like protein (mu-crystallin family)
VTLFLREADVESLLATGDAVEVVDACLRRRSEGPARELPATSLGLDGGRLGVAAAADLDNLRVGATVTARFRQGGRSVLALFSADAPELLAVVETEYLTRLRAAATCAIAARALARAGARSLGVIGCGALAAAAVVALRAACPGLERTVVYCRDEKRRSTFAERIAAEAAGYGREAAEQDVVVTATSSRDPVLRGEWLSHGALVCCAGATALGDRELDNRALERASFVCCDSTEQARAVAGDLVEPVERGVLDWLEVHELADVVAGDAQGRQRSDDIVVAKVAGLPAADVALAALAAERATR